LSFTGSFVSEKEANFSTEGKDCMVCGKPLTGVGGVGNWKTGEVWCKECFEKSPTWEAIKRNSRPSLFSKVLLGSSILLLTLVIIRVVLFILAR
jgi:hypothetical protein